MLQRYLDRRQDRMVGAGEGILWTKRELSDNQFTNTSTREALPLKRYRRPMRCTVCGNLLELSSRSSLRRATGRQSISGGPHEVAVHRLTKL
jgi:hypothetical protein